VTKITYTNPGAARPEVGSLAPSSAERAEESRKIRQAAMIPLVISLGAQWVFFINYWIPEMSAFPANELWLTQLSPLASAALTSDGQPQVQAQNGQWGLPALVLLVCAFALFLLSRTRHWLGRTAMLAPAALGLLAALASVIGLAAKGELRTTMIGVLLLITWVWSAGYASLHGFLDNLAPLPKSWHSGLPLLIAYAVVLPAPTAVGRWLFAPDLRHAAYALQDNTVAFRLAALWTAASVLLYLCGLLLGVAVWVAYQAWPPRRDAGFIGRCLIVIGILIVTAAVGWPATKVAEQRVTELTYESPAEVRSSCGTWILDQPTTGTPQTEPAKTLVISGFTCRMVTTFAGHQQLSTRELDVSLSPVRAYTPEGARISGRIVAAEYGEVIVVAGSNRFDGRANVLLGLGITDSAELWPYVCRDGPMGLRFANVPGGDNPAMGHITQGEVAAEVVASCEGQMVRINPMTGPA
jgi:hypothetical protein